MIKVDIRLLYFEHRIFRFPWTNPTVKSNKKDSNSNLSQLQLYSSSNLRHLLSLINDLHYSPTSVDNMSPNNCVFSIQTLQERNQIDTLQMGGLESQLYDILRSESIPGGMSLLLLYFIDSLWVMRVRYRVDVAITDFEQVERIINSGWSGR